MRMADISESVERIKETKLQCDRILAANEHELTSLKTGLSAKEHSDML